MHEQSVREKKNNTEGPMDMKHINIPHNTSTHPPSPHSVYPSLYTDAHPQTRTAHPRASTCSLASLPQTRRPHPQS